VQTVRVSVRDGVIQDAGSWLYVWRRDVDGDVVYVGATGMVPAVRTWLHLQGDTPSVARVRNRYEGALTEALEVIAFRLPGDVARREAKIELVRQLSDGGLLSDVYVGDPPERPGAETTPGVQQVVTEIMTQIGTGRQA